LFAFFSVVLGWVLLYAATNMFNYLVKSQYQAYHDELTSLGNRRYFTELLENAMRIQKRDNSFIYLLLIDLDHFKTINDTLGHDIGDILLLKVAKRMFDLSASHHNTVSRLGGDEFCILSSVFESKELCLEEAEKFSQSLLSSIKESYIIDEHHLYISASIGLSIIWDPKMQASIFLKEADIAMYEAKNQGRDGVMVFNDELSSCVEWKLDIERLLHFALEDGEITLNFQPQMSASESIIGCEVLVRWNNPQLGQVSPEDFIPISEQTGIILELGHYILEESFRTFKQWNEMGIELEQLSINISMRQLYHHNFILDVEQMCKKYLTPELSSKIVFEMTETVFADDIEKLIENMSAINKCGIRFSMDDFGTGYSSLSYLRQLPLHELKIDKSFIADLGHAEQDESIVMSILDIAKNLNLNIVAEGVESSFQKEFLVDRKCDILQGYHFAKPMDKMSFEKYYEEKK
jgi:diguanylate cyclase